MRDALRCLRCLALIACLLVGPSFAFGQTDNYQLPEFKTETPVYCFLEVPGAEESSKSVLLVLDGDTLYVDRNANRNLTETGEAVVAERTELMSEQDANFEIGELQFGSVIHQSISLSVTPLKNFSRNDDGIKKILESNPKAQAFTLMGIVATPQLPKVERPVTFMVGFQDYAGVLQFGSSIALAPRVRLVGDLKAQLYSQFQMRPGAMVEPYAVVGWSGSGSGTFASIEYDQIVPDACHPALTLVYESEESGEPKSKKFTLDKRC